MPPTPVVKVQDNKVLKTTLLAQPCLIKVVLLGGEEASCKRQVLKFLNRHLLESQDVFLMEEWGAVLCISVLSLSHASSCYAKTILGVQICCPSEI